MGFNIRYITFIKVIRRLIIMMDPIANKLIDCIHNLSSTAVDRLLALALEMLNDETITVDVCPYCGGKHIVRFGKKCGKQRYLCRACGKTFVTTTHTIMSMSHYPATVWKDVATSTLNGDALDFTAKHLGLSHQCVFNMRHKILLALQDITAADPVILGQVSELDETFVLECLKGKKLPPDIGRPARRHGAKAQKRGISAEYICINTGVQRDGGTVAEAINRAKPDGTELRQVYNDHLKDGVLLLCDGLKSYSALKGLADCTIKDINTADETEKGFYHLNTVNNFHSFIKDRYDFYRGVATKYLNRYNTLFSLVWRRRESLAVGLYSKLFHPGTTDYHHGVKDVREMRLLVL